MKCEICKIEDAKKMVVIEDAAENFRYKTTYRCNNCTDTAERSYENVTVTNL